MMSVTRCTEATSSPMVWPACSASAEPSATLPVESSISDLISLAAVAERWASERTSVATTAKPRPCSPARAASTAAFKARMLVWKAMPSMTEMMSAILREEAWMSAMVVTTLPTTLPPCEATEAAPTASWLALRAWSAFCLTVEVSSSIEAAVSSRLAACCSVRRDRSLLPAAISVEAVEMAAEAPWMRETTEVSWAAVALASSRMVANTPWKSPSMRAVRSPCDRARNTPETCSTLPEIAPSSRFNCSEIWPRKPSLPSSRIRPSRSPAVAAWTSLLTSCSTCTSTVRSAHSTT